MYNMIRTIVIITFTLSATFTNAQENKELDFLMLSNIFPKADSRDMQVSFEMWVTDLFKDGGLDYKINLVITSPEDYIKKNYDLEKTFMVVVSSINYLKSKDSRHLEPMLFTAEDTSQTYILVSNRKYSTLEGLIDKKISLTSTGFGEIAEFWLNYLIKTKVGISKEEFFSEVDSMESESKCINSVFFKNVDACIVREKVYQLACELNPQIKDRTVIIERSPQLLHSIFCLTGKFNDDEKQRFLTAVNNIQGTIRGKQILNLFKRTQVFHFEERHLKNTEEIYYSKFMASYRN